MPLCEMYIKQVSCFESDALSDGAPNVYERHDMQGSEAELVHTLEVSGALPSEIWD